MRDTLEAKYAEFKNIIDILPVNTKQNKKKKLDFEKNLIFFALKP